MKVYFLIVLFFSLVCSIHAQPLVAKKKKGKFGFLKGKEVILDYQFDEIDKNFTYYTVSKAGKLGIVSQQGVLVADCKYDEVRGYPLHGYIVSLDGNFGVIDSSGMLLLDYEYEDIKTFIGIQFHW